MGNPVGSSPPASREGSVSPAERYYTDAEIACVVHQMLTGLDLVAAVKPPPRWDQARPARRDMVTALVVAARRGLTAAELYRMNGGGPDSWEHTDRSERLRWNLFTLVVGAMAGEER